MKVGDKGRDPDHIWLYLLCGMVALAACWAIIYILVTRS